LCSSVSVLVAKGREANSRLFVRIVRTFSFRARPCLSAESVPRRLDNNRTRVNPSSDTLEPDGVAQLMLQRAVQQSFPGLTHVIHRSSLIDACI
jgi:hypothetical protein